MIHPRIRIIVHLHVNLFINLDTEDSHKGYETKWLSLLQDSMVCSKLVRLIICGNISIIDDTFKTCT